MINTNKLRGIIKAKGYTLEEGAKAIGISSATMQRKMKAGVFGSDEIDKMIVVFEIQNPADIFFAKEVTE